MQDSSSRKKESKETAWDQLLVTLGKGKWSGNSVEVLSFLNGHAEASSAQWRLMCEDAGVEGRDKRYSACLVNRPYDRWPLRRWSNSAKQ